MELGLSGSCPESCLDSSSSGVQEEEWTPTPSCPAAPLLGFYLLMQMGCSLGFVVFFLILSLFEQKSI